MTIVVIYGDGIGKEIVSSAMEVVNSVGIDKVDWCEQEAGEESLSTLHELVPKQTIDSIKEHRLVIKGPFTTPNGTTRRSANWFIRRELDLFACVRPIKKGNISIDIIRENIEDLYGANEWMSTNDVANAVKIASRQECERISRFAMEYTKQKRRKKVTIVHKANNLKLTEGMFLDSAMKVSTNYPYIETEDMLIDTAAYNMIKNPSYFDTILTSYTYGDILSNIGAAYVGSLGLVPSINYGSNGIVVAEASHGSAPKIARKNIANPIAMILSAALLLESQGYLKQAELIQKAVEFVTQSGIVTPDLGGKATTKEVTKEITNYMLLNLHTNQNMTIDRKSKKA